MKQIVFVTITVILLACSIASAEISLEIGIADRYLGDGDTLSLDLSITNDSGAVTADVYLLLEIDGIFYFYPSFSSTILDFETLQIQDNETRTITIIPPIVLPDDLPTVTCRVYAAAFFAGSYDLVSNVAVDVIRMQSRWEDLPVPDDTNTFYFMPGVNGLDHDSDLADFYQVAQDFYEQFPVNGLYWRRGVTLLDPVGDGATESNTVAAAEKIHETGLALGFHVGVTCHHNYGEMGVLRQTDRRLNQWDSDGQVFNTGSDDMSTVTLSRYAAAIVALRQARAEAHGRSFSQAQALYPDTAIFLNGPIEVEFRKSEAQDLHYADYSPFLVKEFRDWLCHRGIYHDVSGQFAGDGCPLEFIDNMNFSGDPSPSVSATNGLSFNTVFGTAFTTWDLRYWDPDQFPGALPMDADPMPGSGQNGFIDGGFDPPRDTNGALTGGNTLFQSIWDGWRSNRVNGTQTGYGFRQFCVHRYIEDNARWIHSMGVPVRSIFTHQIPSDFLGNFYRERSSASPFWTAINEFSNPGYTAYFDTTHQDALFLATQYLSPRWGLFEYHPDPFKEQNLDYFLTALEKLYMYRCQFLVPLELYHLENSNYQLIGSDFQTAVNLFLSTNWPGTEYPRFDQPYFNTQWIDYTPPPVTGESLDNGLLTWSNQIWSGHPHTWSQWSSFSHFEVYGGSSPDFDPHTHTPLTTATSTSATVDTQWPHYKVLAVSKAGLKSRE